MKVTVYPIPNDPAIVFEDIDGIIESMDGLLKQNTQGKRLLYVNTEACQTVVLDDSPTEQPG